MCKRNVGILALVILVAGFIVTACQQPTEINSTTLIPDENRVLETTVEDRTQVVKHEDGYEEVLIWSNGVRLVGRVYTPTELTPGQKLPGILLVNGWGGTVKNTSARYAKIFAEQGYLVLTQDYKGWGKSNGPLYYDRHIPDASEITENVSLTVKHLRHIVDPISFAEDTEAAFNFLISDPRVQKNNIGVWGTSMGGGVAMLTVARHENVKAFVDQIGAVNHEANFFMIAERTIREAEAGVARGEIPSIPDPSMKAEGLSGYPNYIAMKRFEPFDFVGDINVPTLIIDAEDEEFFDRMQNGKAFHDAIKDRVESKYVVLPGKHYDIYRQESPKAIEEAIIWFNKHLKGE
jgi:dipeptidyl aminopeptidase/acylaminoacyl peptidase